MKTDTVATMTFASNGRIDVAQSIGSSVSTDSTVVAIKFNVNGRAHDTQSTKAAQQMHTSQALGSSRTSPNTAVALHQVTNDGTKHITKPVHMNSR
jgi:hypothetical protein